MFATMQVANLTCIFGRVVGTVGVHVRRGRIGVKVVADGAFLVVGRGVRKRVDGERQRVAREEV